MGRSQPPSLALAPSVTEEARSLQGLARTLIEAASAVDRWADNPGQEDLETIRRHVVEAAEQLSSGILAHLAAGAPTLEKLQWILKVLGDRERRLLPARDAVFFDHRPEMAEERARAIADYDQAYRAYLDAQQAVYRHPDFVPKRARKRISRAR